jgi:hypothetical protein
MTTPLAPPQSHDSPTITTRSRRVVVRGIVGGAATLAFATGMLVPALAAPGDTDAHSTVANVHVTSAIAMTGTTANFTLTGLPGATVAQDGIVTFTVTTNDLAGYAVTVESATGTLLPADPVANTDTIPIGALSVRETGTTPYTPLDNASVVTVHTQAVRSAQIGDALSNDYRVIIPFVNEDTYTATLNYVATAL